MFSSERDVGEEVGDRLTVVSSSNCLCQNHADIYDLIQRGEREE
jgi:hypothetical protein